MRAHQAIGELERDRPHNEQVDGCDAGCMIAQERLPALRPWSPAPIRVFGYRRLGYGDPQHQQLAMYPRRSPERILFARLPDEPPDLAVDLKASHRTDQASNANRLEIRAGASGSPSQG